MNLDAVGKINEGQLRTSESLNFPPERELHPYNLEDLTNLFRLPCLGSYSFLSIASLSPSLLRRFYFQTCPHFQISRNQRLQLDVLHIKIYHISILHINILQINIVHIIKFVTANKIDFGISISAISWFRIVIERR